MLPGNNKNLADFGIDSASSAFECFQDGEEQTVRYVNERTLRDARKDVIFGLDPANIFTQSQPVLLFTAVLITHGFYLCTSHDPQHRLFWVVRGDPSSPFQW